ncbi:MAG: hypothetical protein NTW03_15580 [Verrucomicrobia bacterium]|nr:hypothetical protein [Verrucomicrobiota bacterium]
MITKENDTRRRALIFNGTLLFLCGWGFLSAASSPAAAPSPKWHPGHYIFVNSAAINPKEHVLEHFQGVQKCYGWSALETEEGRYDFSAIKRDAALLKNHGKHLVIQVQSPDYSVANKMRTAAFDRGADRDSVKVTPQDEVPIPVAEHLKLAQDQLKLNYLFWSMSPRRCFENVKVLLAEPGLARDPAGGLDARLPTKAFAESPSGRE